MEAQEFKEPMSKSMAARQKRRHRVNKRQLAMALFDQSIVVTPVVQDNVQEEAQNGQPVLPDLRSSKRMWERQAMLYRQLLRHYEAVQRPM
jgi:hypothetical protein